MYVDTVSILATNFDAINQLVTQSWHEKHHVTFKLSKYDNGNWKASNNIYAFFSLILQKFGY